jgi:hypothetical protein
LPLEVYGESMTVHTIAALTFTIGRPATAIRRAFMEVFQQHSGNLLAADESRVEGTSDRIGKRLY